MKRTKNIKNTVTVTLCDFCGEEAVAFLRRVKPCQICKKDVCGKCAIVTDHWCLEQGEFMGDYPDHYCQVCWDKGKDIRKRILNFRDEEGRCWDEWHKLEQG